MVGCPAGILPVTTETAEDQAELGAYTAADTQHRVAREASTGARGCPLGVQVNGGNPQIFSYSC